MNDPTSDPAGQEPPARPIEYILDYIPDEPGDGWFNVQFQALTSDQVTALLRAARKALNPPIQGADGRWFVAQRRYRGALGDSNFIHQAVAAHQALEQLYEDEDRRVTDQDLIDYFRTSRATFYARIGDEGYQFGDIARMAHDNASK
jgi:hypothetical protein